MLSGELVYTGFTRTFLFGVASSAPVRGRLTPLMNEYFASIADVHRILGVLDEKDDKHPSADGKEKTVAGSIARLARMVGRDAADLTPRRMARRRALVQRAAASQNARRGISWRANPQR